MAGEKSIGHMSSTSLHVDQRRKQADTNSMWVREWTADVLSDCFSKFPSACGTLARERESKVSTSSERAIEKKGLNREVSTCKEQKRDCERARPQQVRSAFSTSKHRGSILTC